MQLETTKRDRDSQRQEAQRAEQERAAAETEAKRLTRAAEAGRAAQARADAAGAAQQPKITVVQEVEQEEEQGGPLDAPRQVSAHAHTCLQNIWLRPLIPQWHVWRTADRNLAMLQEQDLVADEPGENMDEDGESGSELESDEEDEIPQASQAPTGRRSVLGFIGGLFGRTPVRPTSVVLRSDCAALNACHDRLLSP